MAIDQTLSVRLLYQRTRRKSTIAIQLRCVAHRSFLNMMAGTTSFLSHVRTYTTSPSFILTHISAILFYRFYVLRLNAHHFFSPCVQYSFLMDTTTRLSPTQIARCSCSSFRSFADEDQECCHWRVASKRRVVWRRRHRQRSDAPGTSSVSSNERTDSEHRTATSLPLCYAYEPLTP